MKKTLILIITLTLSALSLSAATPWLKRPLRFVPADSVATWGYDGHDLHTLAYQTDSTIAPPYLRLTRQEWQQRKQAFKQWENGTHDRNCVGGSGTDLGAPQGLAAARWIDLARQLFLTQGHADYMDYAERAIFNAVMHTVNDSLEPRGTIDKLQAAQMLLCLPGMMYATSNEGDLYVNLYANSTTRIPHQEGSFTLDQITDMPRSGSVKFRLMHMPAQGIAMTMRVRVPDWTAQRPNTPYIYVGAEPTQTTIYVNGHELSPLTIDSKGYVSITRTWRNLDEVYIDLPLQAQYIKPATTPDHNRMAPVYNQVAMQWGPLVYVAKGEGCYFSMQQVAQPANDVTAQGYPILQGTMYQHTDTPQDAAATGVKFMLKPYCEE